MKAKEYRLTCTKNEMQSVNIKQSSDAVAFARNFYQDDINIYESVFVMLLNRKNDIIGWYKVSQGGIDCSVIDTKLICKVAIDSLCSAAILVHNHPSGSNRPSEADIKHTRELTKCLNLFNISLFDHIILTDTDYYSFSDN